MTDMGYEQSEGVMTMTQDGVSDVSDVFNADAASVIQSDPNVMNGVLVFSGTDTPVAKLFDFLADDKGVDAFIAAFSGVSRAQAAQAIELGAAMLQPHAYDAAHLDGLCGGDSVIHSDDAIKGGTPVFKGSRMPVSVLFDNLAHSRDGNTISNFFANYDTFITRKQAAAVLRMAGKALENYAYKSAAR